MRFDLIRFIMSPFANLFADDISRETWLRQVFSEQFTFTHRRKPYYFVPVYGSGPDTSFPIIMGRIGREKIVKENEPPEAGLEQVKRISWTAAHFYIDPRHHADGQKIAMEHSEMGDPLGVVRSMVRQINSRTKAPYSIIANAISEIQSFVSFLKQHPNDITFIQFDLNVPNMFGDRSNVDTEMRVARDRYKAKRARLTLASDQGMQLDDERIREIASYSLEGGGELKAKTQGNEDFYSSKTIETANIDAPEDADERTILSIIWDRIFKR